MSTVGSYDRTKQLSELLIPYDAGSGIVSAATQLENLKVNMKMSAVRTKYTVATDTTAFTATGAQISGGDIQTVLNLTGTLGAGAAITLPTVAALVAAISGPRVGQSWFLRIMNQSSANFAWTVTTNTGWTLAGTMTIAQNTYRDFVVTLTSLTAATLQSLGTGTQSAL